MTRTRPRFSTLSTALALAVVLSCSLKMRTASSGKKFVTSPPGLALSMVDPEEQKPSAVLNQDFMLKVSAAAGAAVVATYLTEQPLPWSGEKVEYPSKVEVRRFLHIPIKYLTRLNEKWFGPVNWDRVGLRLGAMDTYALCAGILLQTVMGLLGSIHGSKPEDDAPRSEVIVYDLQVVFTAIAAFASTWTMIIFLFNKIYCTKAISIYHDVNYAVFLSVTRDYRLRAFQSLIIALVAYLVAYTSVLSSTVKGKKGITVAVLVLVFCILMFMEGSNLINDAEALAGESPLAGIEGDNFLK